MVNVCDAIMGSGKSQSAISYMNAHPERRFIYITPYLDEAKRIRDGCPELRFAEPSKKLPEYGFSKSRHTMALIEEGRNISSTHQAFTWYTAETVARIKEKGYVLIIDEEIEVLEKSDAVYLDDILVAKAAGYVEEEPEGVYKYTGKPYGNGCLRPLFRAMQSRNLMRIPDRGSNTLFFWMFPAELFTAFEDVFILTYLFQGQDLDLFLQMHEIPYQKIGVRRTANGGYEFSDQPDYVPEYVGRLGEMIHIVDKEKLNAIGEEYHALSGAWYKRDESDVEQMKKNLYNFFFNYQRGLPANRKMYGSFKDEKTRLRGAGYSNGYVVFNQKATNELREKTALAYCVNLFMNVSKKNYYRANGFEPDEDTYALSVMVQWIWRSAIRDGKEINLYIPSRRMRELLIGWIEKLNQEGS